MALAKYAPNCDTLRELWVTDAGDMGEGKQVLYPIKSQLAVLNTAGWEDTVLWSPYGDEGMGFDNFVCVESVKVSH